MNKKQAVIIVTLSVLIVCAGVLAMKVNGPLYVNDNDTGGGKSTISFNNNEKSTTKSDYFAETKLTREQKSDQTLQQLKSIIDDKNVSKESKDNASKKYTEITIAADNEAKIESILKGKGFNDVVCFIQDDKARIIVKSTDESEKLNDKETRQIKDVVMSVAKIENVEIELRQ